MLKFLRFGSFIFLFVLLVGCIQKPLPRWVIKIQEMTPPIGTEEIFKLPEGEPMSFHQLVVELDSARVIFVGESHDQVEHHRAQVALIRGLMTQGKEIVIAMEMFERASQPVLDQWTTGRLTEAQFLLETAWDRVWSMDYSLYQGILDEAKKQRLKLIGLNVERDLVRKVAEQGIEGLPPEDQAKLPEMDLSDPAHRAYLKTIYNAHREGTARDFEFFYQAQCLWDEGMAETLAHFLSLPENGDKVVLVFAGSGHIIFDFGIPKRFFRRNPLPFKTLILKEWKRNFRDDPDIRFASTSRPLADYLWITAPNPSAMERPKIGLILKAIKDLRGLQIERVIPGSPAERAGLLAQDQLLSVEGKDIAKIREIHDVLAQKNRGEEIVFTILRNGEKKEIRVTLSPILDKRP